MMENYYSHMNETNEAPMQTPPTKKRSPALSRRAAALLMCGGVVASGVLGFGGGMLAVSLNSAQAEGSAPSQSEPIAAPSGSGEDKSILPSLSGTEDGNTLSVSQIVQNVGNTVVEITTEVTGIDTRSMRQYSGTGAGSGVIISNDGYIVTNNHVVEDANSVTVRLKDGTSYPAELVGTDAQTDLAVIKIDAQNLPAADLGSSDTLQVGDEAIAIGNPLGELGGTVTNGIISALNREITIDGQTHTVLQTNAAINQGNSGGGLFNAKGQLIGIVSAKSAGTGVEGLGYAIPIDLAKPVISDLIESGYVTGRGYLGVSTLDIQDTQTAFLYRVPQMGVYIASVENGSPAQTAGLKTGDCILSADGKDIASAAQFSDAVKACGAGKSVTIRVLRDGEELTLTAVLGENIPDEK